MIASGSNLVEVSCRIKFYQVSIARDIQSQATVTVCTRCALESEARATLWCFGANEAILMDLF